MLWNPKKDKPVEVELDAVGLLMYRAADYLETHRWGQNYLLSDNGAVCLVGSLYKMESNDPRGEGSCPLTYLAKKRMVEYLGLGAVFWNDKPERTKAEVIAALRNAAKLK